MAPERMVTAKYRRSVFHSSHDKRLTREDFERAQARATSSKGIAYRRRRRSGIFQRDLVDPTHLPLELVQRKGIAIQITPSHIDSSVRTNVAPSASHDATSRLEVEHEAQAEASRARGITKEDACTIGRNEILSSSHAAHQKHQSPRAIRSCEEVIGGAILERDSKGLFVSSQSEDSQDLDLHNIGEDLFGLQSPIRSPIEQPILPRFSGRSTQPTQHESDSNFDLSQTRGSSSRHPHESHARQPKGNPNKRRPTKKSYKTKNRRHLAENELVLVNSRPVSNTEGSDVEMDRVDVYPFENSQDPISEPDRNLKACKRFKAVGKKRNPLSKVHGNTKIKKNQTPPSTMLGYHALNYSHLSPALADSRDMRMYCSDGFNELESVRTGRMAFARSPRAKSKFPRELLKRMGKLTVVRERNFGAIKDAMPMLLTESPLLKIIGQYKTSAKELFFVKGGDHYNDEAPLDREPDLQPNSREERLDLPLLSVNRLEATCKSTGKLTRQATRDEVQEVTHKYISVQLSKAGTNVEVGPDEEEEMEEVLEEEYETEDFEDEEDEEEAANADSADAESRSSRASSSNDGKILSSQECEDDENESLPARKEEGSDMSEVHSEHGEGEDDVGLEFSTPRKRKPSTVIEYVTPVRQRSRRNEEGGFEFEAEAFTSGEMKFPDELLFDEEQHGERENIIAFVNPPLLVVQGPRNLLRPIQSAPESTAPKRSSFLQPQFIDESDKVISGSQIEKTTITSTSRAPEKPRDTPNIPTILSEELHPTNPELEMRDFIWPPVDISGFHSSDVPGDLQHRRRHISLEIMDSQSPRF